MNPVWLLKSALPVASRSAVLHRVRFLILLFTLPLLLVNCNRTPSEANRPGTKNTNNVVYKTPGARIFAKHCAVCHHQQRIGLTGPPLLPLFLKRKKDKRLTRIIRKGLPATQMLPFSKEKLSDAELKQLLTFLRKPGRVQWGPADVKKSLTLHKGPGKKLVVSDARNLTLVVERGKSSVWVMENTRVLDRFGFKNIHGGLKFTPDRKKVFIPSRDGWIGRYDLDRGGYYGKVRACVYLRNASVTRDGKHLVAACWLPRYVAVFDTSTLALKKVLPVQARISAVYEQHTHDKAVLTLREKPLIGLLDTKSFTLEWIKLKAPLVDFFIDPLDRYLVGTARRGKVISVFDLKQRRTVFEHPVDGMPHLFAATVWYTKGQLYFATPHMRKGHLTVWRMYDWKLIKSISTGGPGYFVRTHPGSPWLWADNGSDQLVLIAKRGFEVKKIRPVPGRKLFHTEFSGDGKLAYVSIFHRQGQLLLFDAATAEEVKRIPAGFPVGKYNLMNKQRQYDLPTLGRAVFREKCWGCHHPTHKAFAPSFASIANKRNEAWIRAQILSPKATHKNLGYKRTVMPKLRLTPFEVDALVKFILLHKGDG